eukprot:1148378-Pelagomonas_calceolata.AAC.2
MSEAWEAGSGACLCARRHFPAPFVAAACFPSHRALSQRAAHVEEEARRLDFADAVQAQGLISHTLSLTSLLGPHPMLRCA